MFRVAAVYAIVAWLIVQIVAVSFPALHLPGWTVTLVVVLVLVGFPVALLLAWAFEMTPSGVSRTMRRKEVQSERSSASSEQTNKMIRSIPQKEDIALPSSCSIAVLPFENLSGTNETLPFVRGLHDDLLTDLSRISAFKVISRTSVLRYKETNKSIPEIANELDVGTVLEGRVQSAGGRMRLNVQMIDALSDTHQWAERYDRKLNIENLFNIQSELTEKIARSLRAKLTPEESQQMNKRPTDNLEAYRLQAQARELLDRRTEKAMRRAAELFREATDLDSNYALAWVGRANALSLLSDYGYEELKNVSKEAEEAVERAMELNPKLGGPYTSLGELYIIQKKGPSAVQKLEKATELQPGYAEAHNWLSWVNQCLGRASEALKSAERAVEYDPLSPEAISNLSASHLANGNLEKALKEANNGLKIEPSWTTLRFYEALALYHLKRFTEAEAILKNLKVSWAGSGPLATLGLTYVAGGNDASGREVMRQLEKANKAFSVGMIQIALDEKDQAFDSFKRVNYWSDYWPTLAVHQYFPNLLDPLRDDQQFQSILQKINQSWGLKPDGELILPD